MILWSAGLHWSDWSSWSSRITRRGHTRTKGNRNLRLINRMYNSEILKLFNPHVFCFRTGWSWISGFTGTKRVSWRGSAGAEGEESHIPTTSMHLYFVQLSLKESFTQLHLLTLMSSHTCRTFFLPSNTKWNVSHYFPQNWWFIMPNIQYMHLHAIKNVASRQTWKHDQNCEFKAPLM